MADYNIYIHNLGGGNNQVNPTKPWKSTDVSPTQSWSEKDTSLVESEQTPPFIANEAIGTLSKYKGKVGVAVAAATAVVETSYQILKQITPFIAAETGDFRMSTAISNYESLKNSIFNPVSTVIQLARQSQQFRLEDQRKTMNRELLGDSEINRYTNRGI